MWEILISYLGKKFLCTRTENFDHPIWYLALTRYILPGKTFSQALLVDSPLLSYIDIWHANFLPPSLTIGEAQDLGPCYTTVEDLTSLRDESVKHVSRSRKDHIPVEGDETQVQATEPEATEAEQNVETVTRRKMTMDQFLLGTQLTT